LGDRHRIGQVLLVRVDQDRNTVHTLIGDDHIEGLPALLNAVGIVAVNNIDESLGVLEVVGPEVAQLELTADVPGLELDVLVLKGFHVEANRWNRVDCLVELHLVKDGRLAGGVEAKHEQADGVLLAKSLEEGGEEVVSHCLSCCFCCF